MRSKIVALEVLCVIAIIGCTLVVLGDGSDNAVISPTNPHSISGSGGVSAAQREHGPVEAVRFALYDAGILPRERRVSQGRIVISLVDYTGGTGGLIVERMTEQGRELAGQVRRNGAHWRGRHELPLRPGTYRLHDASKPQNFATLIVEP